MNTEEFQRKLTAILSTDVQGYSRLMQEDEDSTVRTLTAYRALMANLIQKHRGHVVDSPGDNLLAEFGSVMDAVRCAVEIQEELRIRNAELPEDRRMLFRIGVNLGDVIEEGERIYGDGVNIAARLEGLAEAGGVCISGSAHEQIKNKLALGYEYIGEHRVKNITEPLKVYKVPMGPKAVTPKEGKEKRTKLKNWQWTAFGAAGAIIVIIGALTIWNFYPREPSVEPASIEPEQVPVVSDVEEAPKTIAVLPFADISPNKDQESFVDGLSEEIRNNLTRLPGLNVIGRTSSFAFKETNKTAQEIGDILGASHTLEGSVRKVGNKLRITTELVNVSDGIQLWSEKYDRELIDIFDIQEDIATRVADKLKLTLEAFNLVGGTDNVEAYELYLTAQGQLNARYDLALLNRAMNSIDAALAIDPKFSLAWVAKARIHRFLKIFGPADHTDLEQEAGLNAALRAIEIEPNLAPAYHSLGDLKTSNCDFIDAELAYRKALEMTAEPLSGSELFIAVYHHAVGYFERAYELLEEIHQNDPLDQNARTHYMLNFALRGDFQQAEDEYQRGEALFEQQWDWGDDFIWNIRLLPGNPLSRKDIVKSSIIWDAAKEYLETPEEGLVELRRIYNEIDNLRTADLCDIMLWAAYFGDSEFALDIMEKTQRKEANYWVWLPLFKQMRQSLRFKEIVREIGLVDYWNKFGWPDICHKLDNGDFECD